MALTTEQAEQYIALIADHMPPGPASGVDMSHKTITEPRHYLDMIETRVGLNSPGSLAAFRSLREDAAGSEAALLAAAVAVAGIA